MREEKPKRFRTARKDGTVGAMEKKIAKEINVPGVKIQKPNGKKARTDMKIETLRKHYKNK
ncbi:MAG: hypothetical protein LBN08_06305 [Lactobacillales bacterium]|jgi:hypothetical protein|nr:hypothetical protein [Lactobacillales bacterium]